MQGVSRDLTQINKFLNKLTSSLVYCADSSLTIKGCRSIAGVNFVLMASLCTWLVVEIDLVITYTLNQLTQQRNGRVCGTSCQSHCQSSVLSLTFRLRSLCGFTWEMFLLMKMRIRKDTANINYKNTETFLN